MQRFDEDQGISFQGKKRRSGSLICLIILAVTTFVLLVISIVFITLYALEKSKPGPTIPQVPKEQKYCGTRACFETSKGMLVLSYFLRMVRFERNILVTV